MTATDNKAPRVSIAICLYNAERFLTQAFDALLAQTYRDFELIVTDNCSTDRTGEICRTYAACDARIRYHRNASNIGAPKNFNLAFSFARGEYFRWSAGNDLCAPELIERCVEVLDKRPEVVLCYPKTTLVDENGERIRDYEDMLDLPFVLPRDRFAHVLWNIRMCNAAFGLMRSSVLKHTKCFGMYPDSDVVFLGELALYGPWVELPEHLFFRRFHDISSQKYPSPYDRMVVFDPGKNGYLAFPRWQFFLGYLAAIHRAPLSWSERMHCYAKMRICLWRWGSGLPEDFKVAAKYLLSGRHASPSKLEYGSKPPSA